jgi:hypothetical protein
MTIVNALTEQLPFLAPTRESGEPEEAEFLRMDYAFTMPKLGPTEANLEAPFFLSVMSLSWIASNSIDCRPVGAVPVLIPAKYAYGFRC